MTSTSDRKPQFQPPAEANGIPTVQAISVAAGVSKSTVSRALNGDPSISKATRERILAIAMSVGYTPNAIARGLSTKQSGVIGFVTSEIEHYFYQEHLQHLGRLAAQRGKQVMLFQIASDGDMKDILPTMMQYRLDGCVSIATAPVSTESIDICRRYQMPIVVLNRDVPNARASSVHCDNARAASHAASLLIKAGHQRIALVEGRANNPVGEARKHGFLSGLAAAEVALHSRYDGDFTFEGALAAGELICAAKSCPDAVFVANDLMAFGVIEALRRHGKRIPDDVSVIGFDNSKIGAWPSFNLTTYAQPVEQMFNRALDLLELDSADPERESETVYIRAPLIVRGSARLPDLIA